MRPDESPNFDKATQADDVGRIRAGTLIGRIRADVPLHAPPLSAAQQGQGQLFNPGKPIDQPWMQTPEDWAKRGDVFFHGTDDPDFEEHLGPQPTQAGGDNFQWKSARSDRDVHFGTYAAAAERRHHDKRRWRDTDDRIVPVRLAYQPAQELIRDTGDPLRDPTYASAEMYVNEFEDQGSISGVADPRALRTWADDVLHADDRGRNVGQVRKQLAQRNTDLSFVRSEPSEETLTQGSMVRHQTMPYPVPHREVAIEGGPDEPNADELRYRVHGQRLGPDDSSMFDARLAKPRY